MEDSIPRDRFGTAEAAMEWRGGSWDRGFWGSGARKVRACDMCVRVCVCEWADLDIMRGCGLILGRVGPACPGERLQASWASYVGMQHDEETGSRISISRRDVVVVDVSSYPTYSTIRRPTCR